MVRVWCFFVELTRESELSGCYNTVQGVEHIKSRSESYCNNVHAFHVETNHRIVYVKTIFSVLKKIRVLLNMRAVLITRPQGWYASMLAFVTGTHI